MAANTASFSNHLAPGIKEIVGTGLGGRESWYSRVCKVITSERNYEDYLAAAGLPMASEKAELQPIQSYDALEGSTKRMSHTVYGIGFEVSEEAWEDDLYKGKGSAIREAAGSLPDSLAEVVEIEAHRMFNSEAFLTSAVPDFLRPLPDNASTIALYSAVGHNPVTGGEVTAQTNQPAVAVDLTVTSYRAGRIAFKRWRDDRNKRIPAYTTPAKLIIPVELEYDAKEIINSTMRPDTANNVENVTKGGIEIVCDPYLDDTDAWFLQGAKHFVNFVWRWRPRMDNFDDRRSRGAVFLAYERFSKIATHWLGSYASPGA